MTGDGSADMSSGPRLAWHGISTHEVGEFAKARARAEVDATIRHDRAVRTVAWQAVDREDFLRLLEMLGLDGEAGSRHGR